MFISFANGLNGLFEGFLFFFFFLLLYFETSLRILYISPLSDTWFASIFSQSRASIFILFAWAFKDQIFNFDNFQLLESNLRTQSLILDLEDFFPIYITKSYNFTL